ncbi:hypothetical protein D3C72_2280400 [compost metagenome]
MDGALDDGETEQEHGQDEVIQGQVVVQVEQAEQLTTGHTVQPILATGERCLHIDEEHQLGQRQGDHGEVDTLTPDRQQTEAQPQQG